MDQSKGGVMMRVTMSFPPKIYAPLEEEAIKRLKESGQLGRRTVTPAIRDIICLCVRLGLSEIRKMDKVEYERLIKESIR